MTSTTVIELVVPPPAPVHSRIALRRGILQDVPGHVAALAKGEIVFMVTDHTVARLYGRVLHRRLSAAGVETVMLSVTPGEASKVPAVALRLQTAMLRNGVRRESVIMALGGGVVGDLGGYVAATILRGIRSVQVPTTLLSQVDSSVGGKTGVDHSLGKNLIGAFHQPEAVYIDPDVLRTLPEREYRNGLSEIVKIALALDHDLFCEIERGLLAIRAREVRVLSRLIARCVGLKAAVVARDEREHDIRKALNLGHTIAHALEASAGYHMKHGEAVSRGLVAESRIASLKGLLRVSEMERVLGVLRGLALPVAIPRAIDRARFLRALAADKKSTRSGPRFVLPAGIGTCVLGVGVSRDHLRSVVGF